MSIVPKRIHSRLSPRAELCCPAALFGNPATSSNLARRIQALRPHLAKGLAFSQRTDARADRHKVPIRDESLMNIEGVSALFRDICRIPKLVRIGSALRSHNPMSSVSGRCRTLQNRLIYTELFAGGRTQFLRVARWVVSKVVSAITTV